LLPQVFILCFFVFFEMGFCFCYVGFLDFVG
jgi:hypothetical protein